MRRATPHQTRPAPASPQGEAFRSIILLNYNLSVKNGTTHRSFPTDCCRSSAVGAIHRLYGTSPAGVHRTPLRNAPKALCRSVYSPVGNEPPQRGTVSFLIGKGEDKFFQKNLKNLLTNRNQCDIIVKLIDGPMVKRLRRRPLTA